MCLAERAFQLAKVFASDCRPFMIGPSESEYGLKTRPSTLALSEQLLASLCPCCAYKRTLLCLRECRRPGHSHSSLGKCCRPPDRKDLLRALGHAMRQRKFEVFRDELFDVGALDLVGIFELDDSEDVDRPESSSMSGRHILVQGFDCVGSRHVPVFFVHVMSA
jgi:hypothetical protein